MNVSWTSLKGHCIDEEERKKVKLDIANASGTQAVTLRRRKKKIELRKMKKEPDGEGSEGRSP